MRKFGFSTGALAKNNVAKAMKLSSRHHADAVEYSALRLGELKPLVEYLLTHGVEDNQYSAFHAPSHFDPAEEKAVVDLLAKVADKLKLHIVVHPDVIHNYELWRKFGNKLCVENMDHRKPTGRTAEELALIFEKLPKARLCFDIGHAHEIDRSMSRAYEILRRYRNRIAHVHASEVSDDGAHRPFSPSSSAAFGKLADMIPAAAPVILETVTPDDEIGEQLREAKDIFKVI